MDVRFVFAGGVELWDVSQLPTLLARTDGLVWVDVPVWDEQAEQTRPRTTPPHLPQSSTRSPRRRKHRNDGGVPEACFWLTSPSPTLVSLADTVSATTDHRVRVLAALRRPAVAELDRVMLVKSSDLTRFDRGSLLP